MKTRFYIIIPLLFCINYSFSQNVNLSGKIVDEISKQELPNATIKIGNHIFLADNKGLFSFQVQGELLNKYGILVSYVGYEGRNIKILDPDVFLLIKLKNLISQLPGVVVSTGAKKIIEQAIENIPINYPDLPFNLVGFQRTYETVNDSDFFSMNDALVKMFVPSYQNWKTNIQIQILQNRSFIRRIDSFKNNKFKDGHWGAVYEAARAGDFVHSGRFFLSVRRINNYSFILRGIINYENSKVYAIDFMMKDSVPGFEGTVFIETASYAFAGITYYFNQLEKERVEKNMGNKDFFTIIQSSFHEINHKWYLKNFHGEQHAVKKRLLSNHYFRKAIIDFIAISIDTSDVLQIPPEERVLKSVKVTDIIKSADESKWKPIDSLIRKEEFKKYITNIPLPYAK
jgi:hypothetical protein